MKRLSLILIFVMLCAHAWPARVYVMSSDHIQTDSAVVDALTDHGHNVTLGVSYPNFDGSVDLSNIDVVYFQASANWTWGDMPLLGQVQLVHWLSDPAHGLLTTEWAIWKFMAGNLRTLYRVLPITGNGAYRGTESVTYTRETANAVINAGVPNQFVFAPSSYAGTESFFVPKSNATVFYSSNYPFGDQVGAGVVGMRIPGGGRSISFSVCAGPSDFSHPDFSRLVANAVTWASLGTELKPNIYVMATRDNAMDDATLSTLQNCGYRPYVGVNYSEFVGLLYMPEVRAVYFATAHSHVFGDMPADGQQALVEFLDTPGNGLALGEWVHYIEGAGSLQILNQVFGAELNAWRTFTLMTFSRVTPNSTLDQGVPSSFDCLLDIYSGTDSHLTPINGGVRFYNSDITDDGGQPGSAVTGRQLPARGRVLHFSSTNGPTQLANENFARLFCNAFAWVMQRDAAVPGDANGDGCVDDTDLAITLSLFGQTGPGLPADFNNDETVDDTDLAIVLSNFGLGC
ncbi:MAG: hypothetical protein HUU60_07385 [Armatimonadetes bacterium]|nr:hypothetical protein [Armatimonadota bacterium]